MEQDSFDVQKIDPAGPLKGLGRHENDQQGKKRDHHETPRKNAADYFHTLAKAVESANELCARKNLLYRFRVYLENNEVFIERSILDKTGKPLDVHAKNISNDDFARLIEDVSAIEGLFFDIIA